MNILIVDDDPVRHHVLNRKLYGNSISNVYSPFDAIKLLKKEAYDVVYLDYDLRCTIRLPGQRPKEYKGLLVAEFIASMQHNVPKKVVFHTMNNIGAVFMHTRMYEIACELGLPQVPTETKPFDEHFLDFPAFYIGTVLHSEAFPCVGCGATKEPHKAIA